MADITPKVLTASDTTTYERGTGKTQKVTRVTYMLGDFGPFTADFNDGTFTEQALRDVSRDKARALEGLTR